MGDAVTWTRASHRARLEDRIEALELQLSTANAALATAVEERQAAEVALLALYDAWGGHRHWDPRGTNGSACPACIEWGKAREEHWATIRKARETAAASGEASEGAEVPRG